MDLPDWMKDQEVVQKTAFLVAGLLIGGTVVFLGTGSHYTVSGQQAVQNLVSILENQTGQDLNLVNVKRSDGMYEVNLKTSNSKLATYYVTADGEKFTSSLTDISHLKQFISAREDFSQCLVDHNVTIYGNISQRTTQLQIKALGGVRTVQPVYRDVSNKKVLQSAVSIGVRRVPATYYDGEFREGVMQLDKFENFTGCTLSTRP
ncbi:MAG: hypothetical protein ABEJ99_01655 [Candidatus Nanohaloarchaea archaeon]